MKKIIFDSSALIPASKYAVDGKRICEHLVESIEIHIPTAVRHETIVQPEKFSSEAILQNLISQQKIVVDSVQPNGATIDILSGYKLGRGEQEAISLYVQQQENFDGLILDDYVAAIVSRRLQIESWLLLDLIVQLERERLLPHELAIAMIATIAPRYNRGFIEHSLQMMGAEKTAVEQPPRSIKEENLENYIIFKTLTGTMPGQPFVQAYRDYTSGRVSLGWIAQALRVSMQELDQRFEENELPFSTGVAELAELWKPQRASARWLKFKNKMTNE